MLLLFFVVYTNCQLHVQIKKVPFMCVCFVVACHTELFGRQTKKRTKMQDAQSIIAKLQLLKHPEGGYYSEIYRSQQQVLNDKQQLRAASTSIYFLLQHGDKSAWHRLQSDEMWHFYSGAPLRIYIWNAELTQVCKHELGANNFNYQVLVPKNHIFAAESMGEFSLVGCTMAPGFDFADFELFSLQQMQQLVPNASENADLIKRFAA